MVLRLGHAESGGVWDVQLSKAPPPKDGYWLKVRLAWWAGTLGWQVVLGCLCSWLAGGPGGGQRAGSLSVLPPALTLIVLLAQARDLRPVIRALGAAPGRRLMIELQPQDCSADRFVAAVRLVTRWAMLRSTTATGLVFHAISMPPACVSSAAVAILWACSEPALPTPLTALLTRLHAATSRKSCQRAVSRQSAAGQIRAPPASAASTALAHGASRAREAARGVVSGMLSWPLAWSSVWQQPGSRTGEPLQACRCLRRCWPPALDLLPSRQLDEKLGSSATKQNVQLQVCRFADPPLLPFSFCRSSSEAGRAKRSRAGALMPTMLMREFPNDDSEDDDYEMPDVLPQVGSPPARKLVSVRGDRRPRLSRAPLQLGISTANAAIPG